MAEHLQMFSQSKWDPIVGVNVDVGPAGTVLCNESRWGFVNYAGRR